MTCSKVQLLPFLFFFGCQPEVHEGVQVDIAVLTPAIPRVFATNLNYEIDLQQAWTVVESVALVPCEDTLAQQFWRVVQWPPVAHAHGNSSATELSIPTLQSLLPNETQQTSIGTLSPPADDYCAVTLTLGPADDDAQGLSAHPEMLNKALDVRGSYRAQDDEEASPLALSSSYSRSTTLTIERFTLDADHPEHSIRLELQLDKAFDDVDFTELTGPTLSEKVFFQLAKSVAMK